MDNGLFSGQKARAPGIDPPWAQRLSGDKSISPTIQKGRKVYGRTTIRGR
jgi:hypothetical protein